MLLANSVLSHCRVSKKLSANVTMHLILQHIQAASDLLPNTLHLAIFRNSALAPGQITAIIPSSSRYSITPVIRSGFGSVRKFLESIRFLLP